MSMSLKTAVIQHALDVSQIYKDNATLNRALPQALPRWAAATRWPTSLVGLRGPSLNGHQSI